MGYSQSIQYGLFSIGAIYALKTIYSLFNYLSKLIIPNHSTQSYQSAQGWAVVTGASDGIGLQFSKFYAKLGFNVLLIARNKQKLDKACKQLIEINNSIKTQTIIMDFSQPFSLQKYQELALKLNQLHICILINNVGMGITYFYHEMTQKEILDQINVNCVSMLMMCRIVIPIMKIKGLIINVSSMSSLYEYPFLANYASTKAYMNHLSESLRIQNPHLSILTITPQFVSTKLIFNHKGITTVSTKQLIENTKQWIGRQNIISGCMKHAIMKLVMQCMGKYLREWWIYNYLKNVSRKQKIRKNKLK